MTIMPLYCCKWDNVTIVMRPGGGGVTYMGVARKMMHSHSIMYIIWPLSRMWFPSSSSDDSLSKLRPPSWSKTDFISNHKTFIYLLSIINKIHVVSLQHKWCVKSSELEILTTLIWHTQKNPIPDHLYK